MKKLLFLALFVFLLLTSLTSCFLWEEDVKENSANTQKEDAMKYLSAKVSDPAAMGWMVGAPPPSNRIVHFYDSSYFEFPALRWTVSNFRQLMPTVNISRGIGNPSVLEFNLMNKIDNVEFRVMNSIEKMTWEESLYENYTDGIIILHKGKVVYEKYFGVLNEEGQHSAMSVTKSIIGTLASMLVAEGTLDENKLVKHYLPELASSGFGDATLRQVMDMTTGIKFSEDYTDPNAEVWQHASAGNPLPKPEGYTGPNTYYEFLATIKKESEHGTSFGYKTANTDCLGWIITRVTGIPINELISERIWKKLGSEQSAYMTVDSIGTPFAGGGFNAGLRDLARFGQMLLQDGYYNGQQILPVAAIEDIKKGGSKRAFEKADYDLLDDWSYRNMWWITHNEHNAFAARGVHGQTIYIDPKADMVIVRFASAPEASNEFLDPTTLPAFHSVAEFLMDQ